MGLAIKLLTRPAVLAGGALVPRAGGGGGTADPGAGFAPGGGVAGGPGMFPPPGVLGASVELESDILFSSRKSERPTLVQDDGDVSPVGLVGLEGIVATGSLVS